MRCPPKLSSTTPLISPRYFCWSRKCFCEIFTTILRRNAETGRITTAMSVIIGEIESIIIRIPMIEQIEVIIWVILWLSPIPRVSTSFVTLESTSP